MSDPERAVISVTTRIADLGSCTDCQQGGLLQLCSRWYPRPARRSECIIPLIPLLRELHWLRVPSHITAVRSGLYRCLHGTAPAYLAESLHRTSDVDTQRRLRSADSDVQHSVAVPSQWLRHVRGTACRRLSGMHRR